MQNWIEQNNKLQKTFVFKSFVEAIAWMSKASLIIDKMDHHPEWTNIYNRVQVSLSTHDAGNIVTEKDTMLAEELDLLFTAMLVK